MTEATLKKLLRQAGTAREERHVLHEHFFEAGKTPARCDLTREQRRQIVRRNVRHCQKIQLPHAASSLN